MKLWDLMKASKGIPVSDPMARLWGYQYQPKHGVSEISGVPPLRFMSRGGYLQDYRIYGNTVQNGTPTPENPVEVQGCGVRTGNLFPLDESKLHAGRIENDGTIDYEVGTLTVGTDSVTYEAGTAWRGFYTDFIQVNENENLTFSPNNNSIVAMSCNYYDENGGFLGKTPGQSAGSVKIFTLLAGTKKVRISVTSSNTSYTITKPMLNTGSTTLPYEPYGYKIPVTVSNGINSVTTPVYVGSEPLHKIEGYADYVDFERGVVVRRIKKIILRDDGLLKFSNFRKNTTGNVWRCDISFGSVYGRGVFTEISDTIPRKSSHFSPGAFSSGVGGVLGSYSSYLFCPVFSLSTIGATGETDSNIIQEYFLNWLDAQYEAGTPVTVWYVLAKPEEEPLENLLPIQTIKGSDVLTADTTVQPSEMYIKYRR